MEDQTAGPRAAPAAPDRVWLVGCGAMGGALAERWAAFGLGFPRLAIIDPAPRGPVPAGLRLLAAPADAAGLAPGPTAVVLAVKPQQLREAAQALAPWLVHPPLIVSVLAGVRLSTLAALLPGGRLVRAMPNLPARIGKGVTVLHAPALDAADRAQAEWLFRTAGEVIWLDDETRFDAVTALSGSGPAYVFRMIEAMAGAGEAAGLEAGLAETLARMTVIGTAALAEAGGESAAALRQQVTSPGGTTEAGLDALDGAGALSALMRATVRAASERARVLAAQAEALLAEAEPPAREASAP